MSNCPARAGFTPPTQPTKDNRQDHPRSRGVYGPPSTRDSATDGSSPLARGLLAGVLDRFLGARIIPARAGFTHRRHHPPRQGQGSSPLARGLRCCVHRRRPGPGIIPARAGFTPPSWMRPARPPDHPRSRGVYVDPNPPVPRSVGSSPLARGLQVTPPTSQAVQRIIPARAGFTSTYLCTRRICPGSSPLARGLRCEDWRPVSQ